MRRLHPLAQLRGGPVSGLCGGHEVDERVDEARKVAKTATPQHLLVLAALNMAEELFAAEARRRAITEEARSKLEKALKKLGA